jgi:hypothetical protein
MHHHSSDAVKAQIFFKRWLQGNAAGWIMCKDYTHPFLVKFDVVGEF